MTRPLLLDLFCGGGGAAMGYYRAGFDVVGVDINPQPRYPFTFIQGDAMTFEWSESVSAIHASPPCQLYSAMGKGWGRKRVRVIEHPDLLGPTRERLAASGLPFVIENVPRSPIRAGMLLCGTMFGLRIQKHRYFETNWPMPALAPGACDHRDTYSPWSGAGRRTYKMQEAMGIDWLKDGGGTSRANGVTGDLNNAIPPAYTEWIGRQLLTALTVAA